MPKHIEPLHRGLWNAVDEAFLPEGALQTATNVFYKPGDQSLSQAPGRQVLTLSQTISRAPIEGVVPLYWDPGSVKEAGVPELAQIAVVSREDQTPVGLATFEFTSGTSGTKQATRWRPPTQNIGEYLASDQVDAVAMVDRENGDSATWFLLGGGTDALPERNLAISRTRYSSDELVRKVPPTWALVYDSSAGTYTDVTAIMRDDSVPPAVEATGFTDVLPDLNDVFYIGGPVTEELAFSAIEIYVHYHAGAPLDTTWQYWNGSAWTTFTPDFDGTLDWFGTPLAHQQYLAFVDFPTLAGWQLAAVDGKIGRWIRIVRNEANGQFVPPFSVKANFVKLYVGQVNTDQTNDQHLLSHGMPVAPAGALTAGGTTSGGSYTAQTYAWYWWTWYDANHNKEGAGNAGVLQSITGSGSNTAAVLNFNLPTSIPGDATHIRLYRGTSTTSNVDAFPVGIRLATVGLNGLRQGAVTFTDLGPGTGLTSTAFSGTDTTQFSRTTYGLVKVNLGGLSTPASKNGPPPTASTGDVFDESLVLNDVTDPRKLRFSYPGSPHAFPDTFFINFDTKDSDRIVAVRSIGNTLAVFLDRSVWRVNWLPRQSDFTFDRGSVADLVVPHFGAYSHRGVAQFSMPGGGPMLAWVGSDGIYATDNYTWQLLTPQLDWKATVGDPALAMLVNNPSAYRLECYFAPPGSARQTYVMYLHYHPIATQAGLMPITLVQRPGEVRAVTSGVTSAGQWQVASADGKASVLYEGFGTRDESTPLSTPMDVKTREMYLAGIGEDFKQTRTFIHVKPSSTGPDQVVITTQVEGTGPALTHTVDARTGARRLEAPHQLNYGEYLTIRTVVGGAGGFSLNAVGVEFDSAGRKSRG